MIFSFQVRGNIRTYFSQYVLLCIQTLSLYSTPLSLSLSLSLYPSVTADLRPLSAGPLLVAPSWRTASRLGRGRRQCQLYWCRKGHTRQTGPVSAAAAGCCPPAATFTTHTYAPHIYCCDPNARTPASADQCQIGLVRLGPS